MQIKVLGIFQSLRLTESSRVEAEGMESRFEEMVGGGCCCDAFLMVLLLLKGDNGGCVEFVVSAPGGPKN